ncbi:hypothetical protein [Spongiactinospora sp. TRM90649]|uniref:hypothetical protein n=1 Tax=Spongiactinospora sp. TRM90649 TaxID=3031114 RepID=UPI0023F6663B|nr:hypothetical protein [Spongiactinospora sp. TRM90649]MDF5755296.1 hypothetical protein [Spongiactinospora sp. TRM90649]
MTMTTAGTARRTPPLRLVLRIDTVLTGGFAVLLAALAGPLASLLALPEPFLRWAGVVLLPVTAFLIFLATRREPPRAGVWSLITLNVLWTAGSLALLFTPWIAPNALGVAFWAAQAVLVGVFAAAQYTGLRRN